MIIVGFCICDPSHVKVNEVPDTVVSMTPQGIPNGTLVGTNEVRRIVPIPVLVVVPDPVVPAVAD